MYCEVIDFAGLRVIDARRHGEFGYFTAVGVVVDTYFKHVVVTAIIGEVRDGDWELAELEGSDAVAGLDGEVVDFAGLGE